MAKLILQYDLLEERDQADMAIHGAKAYNTIYEIMQHIRKYRKYGISDQEIKLSNQEFVDKLERELYDIINDNEIKL